MRALTSPWNTIDQHRGCGGEHDDAVGEDQPVAPVGQLAGQEPVPRPRTSDSRGKSAKAVLAARMRMAKVENCST